MRNLIWILPLFSCFVYPEERINQKTSELDYPNDNEVLNSEIRDKPDEVVYISGTVEAINAILRNGSHETNQYESGNYELSREDVRVNQRWMMYGTWAMCVFMAVTIILLWWNGCQLRTANRFGRSMALSGIRAARYSHRAAIQARRAANDSVSRTEIELQP